MEKTKTYFIEFILCMKKILLKNIPCDCIKNIYMYCRPRINYKMGIQIKYNANAKMSIQRISEIQENWCKIIYGDVAPMQTISFPEFIKTKMSKHERFNTYKNLAFCQCCHRHYGKDKEHGLGKPVLKGVKNSLHLPTSNKFKRYPSDRTNWKNYVSIACYCPCRHYRRSISFS